MTDAQKLEAIKAEIERRKKLCGQYQELSARKAELECIEIYILTLPDEQSEDCDTCTNDKGCVAFKSADHVQYTKGYNDAVEKACEWLKNNARNYYSAYATEDRLIEDFKTAMEE